MSQILLILASKSTAAKLASMSLLLTDTIATSVLQLRITNWINRELHAIPSPASVDSQTPIRRSLFAPKVESAESSRHDPCWPTQSAANELDPNTKVSIITQRFECCLKPMHGIRAIVCHNSRRTAVTPSPAQRPVTYMKALRPSTSVLLMHAWHSI